MGNTYTRYWDLSEKDRAQLDSAEFDRLLRVEYMERGAAQPAPLNLAPVPVLEPIKTTTWYQVGPVVFADMEQAQKFLTVVNPCTTDYDWGGNYDKKYAKPVEPTITTIELYDESDLKAAKAVLKSDKELRDFNEKELERYRKESEAYESVGSDMRADWYRQQSEMARLSQIMVTYEQYVATAGGDHATASKFIVKAFPTCDVQKCFEWHNEFWANDPDLPQPADEVPA